MFDRISWSCKSRTWRYDQKDSMPRNWVESILMKSELPMDIWIMLNLGYIQRMKRTKFKSITILIIN